MEHKAGNKTEIEMSCLIFIGFILFYTTIVGLYTMQVPEDAPHFQQIGLTALTLAIIYVGLQIQKLADKIGKEE